MKWPFNVVAAELGEDCDDGEAMVQGCLKKVKKNYGAREVAHHGGHPRLSGAHPTWEVSSGWTRREDRRLGACWSADV